MNQLFVCKNQSSKLFILLFLCCTWLISFLQPDKQVTLFEDDYTGLKRGPLSTYTGALTEYHYLLEAAPKDNWAVSNDRGWWSVGK